MKHKGGIRNNYREAGSWIPSIMWSVPRRRGLASRRLSPGHALRARLSSRGEAGGRDKLPGVGVKELLSAGRPDSVVIDRCCSVVGKALNFNLGRH